VVCLAETLIGLIFNKCLESRKKGKCLGEAGCELVLPILKNVYKMYFLGRKVTYKVEPGWSAQRWVWQRRWGGEAQPRGEQHTRGTDRKQRVYPASGNEHSGYFMWCQRCQRQNNHGLGVEGVQTEPKTGSLRAVSEYTSAHEKETYTLWGFNPKKKKSTDGI
jgi:hypothetical protein